MNNYSAKNLSVKNQSPATATTDNRARIVICIACMAVLLSFANSLTANDNTQLEPTAWQALRDGKAVALMRHALAPGVGDPENFLIDDCKTQRNLSDAGRQQAKTIGNTLRNNGINNADVQSSQWCRCQETATLLDIGDVKPSDTLNSFFQDRRTATEQTERLYATIERRLKSSRKPLLLVTHQVNISALTRQHTSSGDILIVTITDGQIRVLHRAPG